MFKSIGIAAFGSAVGFPVWGVALVGIGLLGVGVGIGFAAGGLMGASTGALASII